LKAFHGKDIPVEYAKQEAEAKRRHVEAWQQGGAKRLSESGFTLSGMFGGSSSVRSFPSSSHHETDQISLQSQHNSPIPPTYLEQKRAEAQMMYREEQAYFAANKENFERLLEEDRQAMAKEMSGNLWESSSRCSLGSSLNLRRRRPLLVRVPPRRRRSHEGEGRRV
jgi:import inner membrane translocase subunit TIM50